MEYQDTKIFFTLLDETHIFEDSAKMIIKKSIEDKMLPIADFEYLKNVMKMEQNLYFLVDQKRDKLVGNLKKKYDKNEKQKDSA